MPSTPTSPGQASPDPVPARQVRLTGWGRIAPTTAELAAPATDAEAAALLRRVARDADRPGGQPAVIARGLGRSYNNAAQSAGGLVISTGRLNGIVSLDPATGVVVAEAGVSLEQLMVAGLPHGWFVPVSPGTRQVTVGGAIAADVHGKNHHVAGSFASHVTSFDILFPSADQDEPHTVTPQADPELFWATAGGLGLTGFITRATIQLKRVESSLVKVVTVKTRDVDETMAVLAEHDKKYGYTVAWSDDLASGGSLGRSIITSGDFATLADLDDRQRSDPFRFDPRARIGAPGFIPPGLMNRHSIRLANAVWYAKAPRHREHELQTISQFFHPLDGIRNWNRVYGPGGFRQYQYVLPFGAEAAVRRSFEMVSAHRAPSFVTVLKRFGQADPGLLSFPAPGWTLALDFPARTPGLGPLLDELDRLVVANGGRVYLAKDSRVSAARLEEMYPRLPEFRKLRAELDPKGTLASDLSRRLNL
ncbi:FAD-binding oxidoreductase [Trebonia kvetii]|uniref:FAD-binding oxidoreductase n=1 Tax=Trebonia kvetii TaxID=2480626 RepID=A0A6P2C1N1_9ACTN|nr:FAD-binding oxidoreductase [Trebonia kvetii]TVZ04395.1 FAD-binding oxidoreductase [Trebonia kvetii]